MGSMVPADVVAHHWNNNGSEQKGDLDMKEDNFVWGKEHNFVAVLVVTWLHTLLANAWLASADQPRSDQQQIGNI